MKSNKLHISQRGNQEYIQVLTVAKNPARDALLLCQNLQSEWEFVLHTNDRNELLPFISMQKEPLFDTPYVAMNLCNGLFKERNIYYTVMQSAFERLETRDKEKLVNQLYKLKAHFTDMDVTARALQKVVTRSFLKDKRPYLLSRKEDGIETEQLEICIASNKIDACDAIDFTTRHLDYNDSEHTPSKKVFSVEQLPLSTMYNGKTLGWHIANSNVLCDQKIIDFVF